MHELQHSYRTPTALLVQVGMQWHSMCPRSTGIHSFSWNPLA